LSRQQPACCVAVALILGWSWACGREQQLRDSPQRTAAEPADSLVLRTNQVEVWYTLARPSTGADGTSCVERALEIRRGSKRVPVPLLYTGEPPTLINDSTLRATLWTDCRPAEVYRVDLRNGRPVREHTKDRS
jgi:hypothetical protein